LKGYRLSNKNEKLEIEMVEIDE